MEHYKVTPQSRVRAPVRVACAPLTLPSHSLWQSPEDTFLCQTNPLCVRQEDYIPAEEEKYRHDVSLIPKERLGNLAPWRMISISYVSGASVRAGGKKEAYAAVGRPPAWVRRAGHQLGPAVGHQARQL